MFACFARVSLRRHIKSNLFRSLACDQCVSPYSPTISWWEGGNEWTRCHFNRGRKKMKPFISARGHEKRWEIWEGEKHRSASRYIFPVCQTPTPVALTAVYSGCCHRGQLWTDGWDREGQYVMPDGVLQAMWRFALQHAQFSKSRSEIWGAVQNAMWVSRLNPLRYNSEVILIY